VNAAGSDYIQLHAGDKTTLAESLALIQQTASLSILEHAVFERSK
jgi:hypothetical protein